MKLIFNLVLLFSIAQFGFSQNIERLDEFSGDWKDAKGTTFAQVYITKDGVHNVNLIKDIMTREKPQAVLKGQKSGNSLVLSGDDWTGEIKNNKLTVKKGSQTISMTPFVRTSPTMNAKPPKNGIVLFDGTNLDKWTKVAEKDWLVGGTPADNWKILPGGILEVVPNTGSIITKQKFGDVKLHIEFRLLGEVTNGGVYFQSRYEMNIKDAYGVGGSPVGLGNVENPKDVYAAVNPAFPPMQWQTFDIDYRAPRFDASGTVKTENARITVVHNGVMIYDNLEMITLRGSTGKLGDAGVGPIYLQDHGTAYQFRNIWVVDNTLKGTENYLTAEAKRYVESTMPTTTSQTKGSEKSSGNKAAKNNTGGNKAGGNKAGGNKAGGTKYGGGKQTTPAVETPIVEKKGGRKPAANQTTTQKKGGSKTTIPAVEKKSGNKKTNETAVSTPKKGGNKKADNAESNIVQNPNKKTGSANKKITADYSGELNPFYEATTVNILSSTSAKPAPSNAGFKHPGILLTSPQLTTLKDRISKGVEPQKTAFQTLKDSRYAALDYMPTAYDTVSCGPYSNPNIGCKDEQSDVIAAYSHALMWVITQNKAHAEKAIQIMNDWSTTLTGGHNYANGPIQAAWCGSVWPRAAEIIRYTYTGWKEADIAKFQNMLRTQYLPSIIHGNCENGNKELAMCEALINIGVFNDDKAVFDLGVKMWRGRTPAYIYLKSDGPTPIEPPGCGSAIWGNKGHTPEFVDGLLQETARDSHHAWMAFGSMVNAAETAYIQGVDLYAEQGKRIIAALEFQAQYLKPNNMPWPEKLEFALNPTWEIAYNHYHNRLGMQLPLMEKVIPTNRPTGTNHHMIWETLTHGEMK